MATHPEMQAPDARSTTAHQGSAVTSHEGPFFKDIGNININKGTFIQNNTLTVSTVPTFLSDTTLID
jgi:hypothetical protein